MTTVWNISLRKVLSHRERRFDLDVSFASDATRLALVGPSGGGKTQTLRMIAGITRPDRGRVVLAGRTLFDSAAAIEVPPQQRRMGHVFQDYALFPHLTVRQNIAFGRRKGWVNPLDGIEDASVRRWVDAFHLHDVIDHFPDQISGGQRQRTALARALASDPAALLLDEPFAALDRELRRRLRRELRDLQRDISIPTLLVTHDDEDAAELATQIVHMQQGRVSNDAGASESLA
ncbi:MAG TPA: ATP-binding cassette domain-containing protein [Burkholderiaceae bacterium]|nr:ATP-binding cassette domain-containing protein [Burkholderiaceae bacterium]